MAALRMLISGWMMVVGVLGALGEYRDSGDLPVRYSGQPARQDPIRRLPVTLVPPSGKLHLSFRVFLHLIAEIRSDKT
jgi:hypothetical protein